MAVPEPTDLVEETIVVAGEPIGLLRPRDSDELLVDDALEHEERLPYWAELWPSSVALAQTLGTRSLRGAQRRRARHHGRRLGGPRAESRARPVAARARLGRALRTAQRGPDARPPPPAHGRDWRGVDRRSRQAELHGLLAALAATLEAE